MLDASERTNEREKPIQIRFLRNVNAQFGDEWRLSAFSDTSKITSECRTGRLHCSASEVWWASHHTQTCPFSLSTSLSFSNKIVAEKLSVFLRVCTISLVRRLLFKFHVWFHWTELVIVALDATRVIACRSSSKPFLWGQENFLSAAIFIFVFDERRRCFMSFHWQKFTSKPIIRVGNVAKTHSCWSLSLCTTRARHFTPWPKRMHCALMAINGKQFFVFRYFFLFYFSILCRTIVIDFIVGVLSRQSP